MIRRLLLGWILCGSLLVCGAWAQQPTNQAEYGGNAVPSSGVNGLPAVGGYASQNTSDAAWTSATSVNTRVTQISNITAYNSILVTLVQGTTITGGAVTFQQSNDNTNWVNIQCVNVTTTSIAGPYTLIPSTNVNFLCPVNTPYFGVLLSTAITGTGTVTVGHNALSLPQVGLLAGTETLASGSNAIGSVTATQGNGANLHVDVDAGTAVMGKATIDQTTPGTTNAIEPIPDTSTAVALASSVKATVTSSVSVKTTAGNVYGISVANGAAAVCWVQFINSTGAGTLGSGVIFSIALPASGTITIPPGAMALGNFSSGIAVGVASSTNSSTACGTGANLSVFYK